MSDEMLIRYCAPTLAGLKTASLFTCPVISEKELTEQIRSANRRLLPRGIRLLPLRYKGGRALIYMYRPKRLERDLGDRRAEAILSRSHYPEGDPERRLTELPVPSARYESRKTRCQRTELNPCVRRAGFKFHLSLFRASAMIGLVQKNLTLPVPDKTG